MGKDVLSRFNERTTGTSFYDEGGGILLTAGVQFLHDICFCGYYTTAKGMMIFDYQGDLVIILDKL
ncbi:MAG: hypothetical protein CMI18_13730 [Opitutaceae bacterium]|nr:hypothetical protein [Opitutaceae bacterium]